MVSNKVAKGHSAKCFELFVTAVTHDVHLARFLKKLRKRERRAIIDFLINDIRKEYAFIDENAWRKVPGKRAGSIAKVYVTNKGRTMEILPRSTRILPTSH